MTAFAFCLAIAATAEAGQTVINFDVDTNNNPLPSGTLINNLYSSLGVTFTNVGECNQNLPGVYTSAECLDAPPPSQPNVVTICDGLTCSDISELGNGSVRADFVADVTSVCIEFIPLDGSTGVLRAFDSANVEIATAFTNVQGYICVAQPGIRAVQFSGFQQQFGWFDNLVFDLSVVPVEPTTFGAIKARYR